MTSEMVEAFENMARSHTDRIRVALPGEIIRYDSGSGLCQIRPIGKVSTPTGATLEYPIISGIPICSPAGIAVPVVTGTNCLLIICDADISEWLSGKTAAQSIPHSLQNAVCIPEIRKVPNAMQEYANSHGCVAISGDLYVSGQITVGKNMIVGGEITSTGSVNAPNIP